MERFGRYSVVAMMGLVLMGCVSGGQPPVAERGQPPSIKLHTHQVNEGETLYSIAWIYGKDFRILAAINGIQLPYTIYPGQTLSLEGVVKRRGSSPVPVKRSEPKREVKTQSVSTAPTKPSLQQWRWPSKGKIIKGFKVSPKVHKGIDIGGSRGDPVYAANHGVVVYAGEGIRGYGRLIIVKHSEVYLSAYAHSDRMLVKEGEKVKAGQIIAEIGSSGTNIVKLHFELRRNGNPVNPLSVLPKV